MYSGMHIYSAYYVVQEKKGGLRPYTPSKQPPRCLFRISSTPHGELMTPCTPLSGPEPAEQGGAGCLALRSLFKPLKGLPAPALPQGPDVLCCHACICLSRSGPCGLLRTPCPPLPSPFLGGWGVVGYYGFKNGDPTRLIYPSDSTGAICGSSDKLANRPNLLFFDLTKCLKADAVALGCLTKQVIL